MATIEAACGHGDKNTAFMARSVRDAVALRAPLTDPSAEQALQDADQALERLRAGDLASARTMLRRAADSGDGPLAGRAAASSSALRSPASRSWAPRCCCYPSSGTTTVLNGSDYPSKGPALGLGRWDYPQQVSHHRPAGPRQPQQGPHAGAAVQARNLVVGPAPGLAGGQESGLGGVAFDHCGVAVEGVGAGAADG